MEKHNRTPKNTNSNRIDYPKIWNTKWITDQYVTKEKSIQAIADSVGCYWKAVHNALVKQGFSIRRYTMTKVARKVRQRGGRAKKGKRINENV